MTDEALHTTAKTATLRMYLREMLEMSRKHRGEIAFAIGIVVIVVLSGFAALSLLHLVPYEGPAQVLQILLPAVATILLFEAAVAGWRLYRSQCVALASTRSLLALNASDRVDLEGSLRTLFLRRERGATELSSARIEQLLGQIAALQTEVAQLSHAPQKDRPC